MYVLCAGPPLMTHVTLYLNVSKCIFGTPNVWLKKSKKALAAIAIVAQNLLDTMICKK
jgi:hypothetical protein